MGFIDLDFIELTLEEATGAARIIVRLDEIAYFQAEVREGPEGPLDCGVVVLKRGDRLAVREGYEQFTEGLMGMKVSKPS
jgi:hypothetical protein